MFIVFEGLDGSGKSTQIKKISEYLKTKHYEVVTTREPGGTFGGEIIRKVFLEKNFSPEIQYLLMIAARAEHIDSVILPALDNGKIVLSDRYHDSTEIYQHINDLNLKWIGNKLIANYLADITFILDITTQTALSRINKRNNIEIDNFEANLTRTLIEKNRQNYLELANENPKNYYIIDANQTCDIVYKNIVAIIENALSKTDKRTSKKSISHRT